MIYFDTLLSTELYVSIVNLAHPFIPCREPLIFLLFPYWLDLCHMLYQFLSAVHFNLF